MKYQYSYSRLSSYQKCPFYFKCKHIDKIKTKDTAIQTVGSVGHAVVAAYVLSCYKDKLTHKFDEWKNIAYRVIAEHNVKSEYEDDIMYVCNEFVTSREVALANLAGVEERIAIDEEGNVVDWRADNVWFRAVLDLVYMQDNLAKIVDYKMGYNFKPDKFQLEVYWWILNKIYPHLELCQADFDLVRFTVQKNYEFAAEDAKETEKKLLEKIKVIEKDTEFAPQICSWCDSCPYWDICPAMKGRNIKRVPNGKKDAKELLEEVIASDKKAKELKKLLQKYVERYGEISTGDRQATVKVTTSYNWNIKKLIEFANEKGVYILDALKGDSRKLQKIEGIEPTEYADVKMYSRFAIGKVKNEKRK